MPTITKPNTDSKPAASKAKITAKDNNSKSTANVTTDIEPASKPANNSTKKTKASSTAATKSASKAKNTSPKPNKKEKKEVEGNKPEKDEIVIDNVDSNGDELTIPPEIEELPSENKDKEDYSTVLSQYEPIYWDGNIPKPTGFVAKEAAKTPTDLQVKQYKDIIELLNDNNTPTLETLSHTTPVVPFIVAVPGRTRNVKVVYGIGAGCRLTGLMANDLGEDILVLNVDIDPLFSMPVAHQLPKDALIPKPAKIPTMVQFLFQRKKQNQSGPFWLQNKEVRKTSKLTNLIPIPALLVYNSFNDHIDSVIVLERWYYLRETLQGVYKNFDALLSIFI